MTVAVIGIIASVSAAIMLQVNRYFSISNARLDVERESRAAMYVITRNLRQAQNATITIDNVAGQPFYSRITFTTEQGQTMTFYQNGMELIQQVGNSQTIMAKDLFYLAFTFPRSDEMTIVSVSMTIQAAIYQGRTQALHTESEQVQVMN